MPKGVLNINIVSATSVIGFASLLGTLNLYLQKRGLAVHDVTTLTASFFGLNFLLHFLGGTLGGSLLSYRNLFFISLLLQILGLFGIASSDLHYILAGMAAFLTGSGLNVSCINMMLTHRFKPGDMKRRVAFSVNYSCMNLGFIISFILANIFQAKGDYQTLFIVAAGGLIISLFFHVVNWRHVKDNGTYFVTHFHEKKARYFAAPLVVIACFLVTLFLMHHASIASGFIYFLFFIGVIIALYFAKKSELVYRHKIYAYMILMGACISFAFVQGLMSTALSDFVAYNTSQHLFGVRVTASGVSMADSIGVLLFGFVLAKILARRSQQNNSIKPETIVASGLAFNIPAFLIIPLGIWMTSLMGGSLISVFFPLLMMFVTAAAEIQVNSTNYAMAGELGKLKHQGFLTGYMFLNIAVGVNLSGPFSNLIVGRYHHLQNVSPVKTNPLYFKMFLMIAGFAAVLTLVYWGLRKYIGVLRGVN